MAKEMFGSIPLIERAKIQAQVLVPVLQAFRAELGEERANRIAWQALAQWRRDTARGIAAELPGSPREKWQAAMEASLPLIGDSVDFDMLKQSEEALNFAQFLAVCSRSKWSRHLTKSPFLALLATAGSSAAYKIISACSNAVS